MSGAPRRGRSSRERSLFSRLKCLSDNTGRNRPQRGVVGNLLPHSFFFFKRAPIVTVERIVGEGSATLNSQCSTTPTTTKKGIDWPGMRHEERYGPSLNFVCFVARRDAATRQWSNDDRVKIQRKREITKRKIKEKSKLRPQAGFVVSKIGFSPDVYTFFPRWRHRLLLRTLLVQLCSTDARARMEQTENTHRS